MQVKYANKLSRTHWDPVHLTYSVRKLPDHDSSSEHIARRWRSGPEIIKDVVISIPFKSSSSPQRDSITLCWSSVSVLPYT